MAFAHLEWCHSIALFGHKQAIPFKKMNGLRILGRFLLASLITVAGCAAVNEPINPPGTGRVASADNRDGSGLVSDGTFVGLAFSGGGTRASSFAYGMLQELRATGRGRKAPDGLLSYARLVSGVSGGSVTAA